MLDDGLVAGRAHICSCAQACSHVRGRAFLKPGLSGLLTPLGILCARANITVSRTKPRLTSTAAAGIANKGVMWIKGLWSKFRGKMAPGRFGAAQADVLWSESERHHLRPGNFCVFELGDASDEKGNFDQSFSLPPRRWMEYQGTRF